MGMAYSVLLSIIYKSLTSTCPSSSDKHLCLIKHRQIHVFYGILNNLIIKKWGNLRINESSLALIYFYFLTY